MKLRDGRLVLRLFETNCTKNSKLASSYYSMIIKWYYVLSFEVSGQLPFCLHLSSHLDRDSFSIDLWWSIIWVLTGTTTSHSSSFPFGLQ
jgi:hypothetical protein